MQGATNHFWGSKEIAEQVCVCVYIYAFPLRERTMDSEHLLLSAGIIRRFARLLFFLSQPASRVALQHFLRAATRLTFPVDDFVVAPARVNPVLGRQKIQKSAI